MWFLITEPWVSSLILLIPTADSCCWPRSTFSVQVIKKNHTMIPTWQPPPNLRSLTPYCSLSPLPLLFSLRSPLCAAKHLEKSDFLEVADQKLSTSSCLFPSLFITCFLLILYFSLLFLYDSFCFSHYDPSSIFVNCLLARQQVTISDECVYAAVGWGLICSDDRQKTQFEWWFQFEGLFWLPHRASCKFDIDPIFLQLESVCFQLSYH